MSDKKVENTTKTNEQEPMRAIAAMAFGGGAGQFIENQEAEGQRQLVEGISFPTKGEQDEALIAMGFDLGDPYPSDPMFRDAKLPQGWKKQASDHSMWSYIVDEKGRKRVAVFYKAAFYDRSAHYYVETRLNVGRNYNIIPNNRTDKEPVQHQVKDAGAVIYETDVESFAVGDWSGQRAIEERQRADCKAWLDENYPGNGDLIGDWSLAREGEGVEE